MSLCSSREDINDGSIGVTDRGAQRPHAPRAPSPILEREFRRAILKEPLEDLEYTITLEEPNGQETKGEEDRNKVKAPGRETPGFHAPQCPLPEAHARKQTQKVMVMIRKIPS